MLLWAEASGLGYILHHYSPTPEASCQFMLQRQRPAFESCQVLFTVTDPSSGTAPSSDVVWPDYMQIQTQTILCMAVAGIQI